MTMRLRFFSFNRLHTESPCKKARAQSCLLIDFHRHENFSFYMPFHRFNGFMCTFGLFCGAFHFKGELWKSKWFVLMWINQKKRWQRKVAALETMDSYKMQSKILQAKQSILAMKFENFLWNSKGKSTNPKSAKLRFFFAVSSWTPNNYSLIISIYASHMFIFIFLTAIFLYVTCFICHSFYVYGFTFVALNAYWPFFGL